MYGYNVENYCDPCSFSYGYGAPAFAPTVSYGQQTFGRGFAFILVLFILLLIIGAVSYVV